LLKNQSDFSFTISSRGGDSFTLARAGTIHTPHGDIQTPAFIPVGTRASVKGVTPDQMKAFRAQALLANAYHLRLRPGPEVIDEAGGLGKFMGWDAPTFTDSGGFQVMSLGVGFKKVLSAEFAGKGADKDDGKDALEVMSLPSKKDKLASVDNDGVTFKSHLDGAMLRFTPEISLQVQHMIGADIMFAFDELTTLLHPYEYQVQSLEQRTHPWALRSLEEHYLQTVLRGSKPYQALYGVVQGANFEDLRRKTCRFLAGAKVHDTAFDGFGIGGALEKERLGEIVGWCSDELNRAGAEAKPRHLLGISGIEDLFAGVESGVDTFDCVSPAREGRNGALYTKRGRINLKNTKYTRDFTPVEEGCTCYTCQNFTKAYLNHLLKVGEMLGGILGTIHNEHFILKLVDQMRERIVDGTFMEFKRDFLGEYLGVEYAHSG
jgi:queuine tRNA-ribosyltransferase